MGNFFGPVLKNVGSRMILGEFESSHLDPFFSHRQSPWHGTTTVGMLYRWYPIGWPTSTCGHCTCLGQETQGAAVGRSHFGLG